MSELIMVRVVLVPSVHNSLDLWSHSIPFLSSSIWEMARYKQVFLHCRADFV